MGIEIRILKLEDLDQISKLYVDVYNGLHLGESWNFNKAKELFLFYLESNQFGLVAVENSEIIGCIIGLIKPWWDGDVFTDFEIFVKKDRRGERIGTRLLEKCLTELIEVHKISKISGTTYTKPPSPFHWYKNIGFEEDTNIHINGNVELILSRLKY